MTFTNCSVAINVGSHSNRVEGPSASCPLGEGKRQDEGFGEGLVAAPRTWTAPMCGLKT